MNTTPPISLRRATPQDAAATARLMAHPAVHPNLMQLPYANEESWRPRLTEMLAPGKTDILLVAERPAAAAGCDNTGEPRPAGTNGMVTVGLAGLHPAGPALRRRHVMSLGISVAPEAHGQGVGTALLRALCDYADRWAQVLRIELTVFADNARAIALYQRCGFQVEGRHVGYALRDGRYVDTLSMARLHPLPPTWAPVAS